MVEEVADSDKNIKQVVSIDRDMQKRFAAVNQGLYATVGSEVHENEAVCDVVYDDTKYNTTGERRI